MKASVKLREKRSPLCRAKVPITILGLPFRAAVVAGGDSKEVSLSLATLFPSGPSIGAVYHPNDPRRPFSLLLKTGTISHHFSFTIHFDPFNLLNPKFLLRFRPSLGSFSLTHSLPSPSSSFIQDTSPLSSCVGVTAMTELPILSSAVLSFRWKVGLPSGLEGIGVEKLPALIMEKVGLEHVVGKEEVGGVCFQGRRVLEIVERECGMMRRCVEGLVKEKKGEIQRSGAVEEEEGGGGGVIEDVLLQQI